MGIVARPEGGAVRDGIWLKHQGLSWGSRWSRPRGPGPERQGRGHPGQVGAVGAEAPNPLANASIVDRRADVMGPPSDPVEGAGHGIRGTRDAPRWIPAGVRARPADLLALEFRLFCLVATSLRAD